MLKFLPSTHITWRNAIHEFALWEKTPLRSILYADDIAPAAGS